MKNLLFAIVLCSCITVSAQEKEELKSAVENTKNAFSPKKSTTDNSVNAFTAKKNTIQFTEWTIKKSRIKPALENLNFKLGFELLRTDKYSKELLLRQRVYPFEKIACNVDPFLASYLYFGQIITPFKVYNPVKKDLAEKSDLFNKIYIFTAFTVIPIKKTGNKYTFQIVYSTQHGKYGATISYQDIELSLGESVKIDTEQIVDWQDSDIVDGQKLLITSNGDFYNFVKEYLIISLDNIE